VGARADKPHPRRVSLFDRLSTSSFRFQCSANARGTKLTSQRLVAAVRRPDVRASYSWRIAPGQSAGFTLLVESPTRAEGEVSSWGFADGLLAAVRGWQE
jgi:hypothetical protein